MDINATATAKLIAVTADRLVRSMNAAMATDWDVSPIDLLEMTAEFDMTDEFAQAVLDAAAAKI